MEKELLRFSTHPADRRVSIWQLANDPEAYGDQAGHFILSSPDGEFEFCEPEPTVEAVTAIARSQGWQIVPLTLGMVGQQRSDDPRRGDQR